MTRKVALLSAASLCASLVGIEDSRADFLEDAKGKVLFRNLYYNRDHRDSSAAQGKREDWVQGAMLQWESGFTRGPIGFGFDVIGMLGQKLDNGSRNEGGGGMLPRDKNGSSIDHVAEGAATLKMAFKDNELRYGGLMPKLPLLYSNFSRLFPQIFNGGQWVSKPLEGLTLTAARVDRVKQRDSTDYEPLTITTQSGAYKSVTSDQLLYAGADYQVNSNLTLSYHWSELRDIFRRDYIGAKFNHTFGAGNAFGEIRYFMAQDSGRALAGNVDNNTLSTNFGYQRSGHTVSAGFQQIYGKTAFALVGGTDTYIFGEQMTSQFALADERVWYVGYEYDFAPMGIPGLKFSTRYANADNIDPTHVTGSDAQALRARGARGKEWERGSEISYVVQSGSFKNLGFRWRNATNRSDVATGVDENRVFVDYVFNF